MEILVIALSGLLSLVSGGGAVLDSVAASRIFAQASSSQVQALRIDNTPSYQAAQGKIGKVRVVARDLEVKPDLKIAVLELETEQIHVDPAKLNLDSIDKLRKSLQQPLQGAGKLVLTETHLNQALQSPEILAQLEKTLNRLISRKSGSTNIAYELRQIQVELNPANSLGVKLKLSRPSRSSEVDENPLREPTSNELAIALNLKLKVVNSKTIRLVEPEGTVNGRPMSPRLLNGFATGISDRLNLDFLETDGILARILQLEINEDRFKLVGFLKLETKESSSASKEVRVTD